MSVRLNRFSLIALGAVALVGAGCKQGQPTAATTPAETPAPYSPANANSTPAANSPAASEAAPAKTGDTGGGILSKLIPKPPPPVQIPAGTAVSVRLGQTLSTKTAQPGQAFEATLNAPLVIDGVRVASRGATARGVVVSSDDGGRVKGRAQLAVRLTSLVLANDKEAALQTAPVYRTAPGTKKKDALKVGIGSGIGAAIGAIAGGGRGAAIGAGAGAGAGTGVVLATHGDPAVLPVETLLSFKLSEPIEAQGPFPAAAPVKAAE